MKAAFRFNGDNPAAQRVAARQAARMVTRITNETIQAIRSVVVSSIRDGVPPYDAARAIRSMVGMTAPQAQAAMNYRAEMIDSGLSIDRVNALLDRYTEKKVRQRAEMIARTETLEALNTGALEAFAEARAEGLLGDDPKKEWITTPAESTCDICAPLDGVQVPLGEPFRTDEGEVDGPPLHPQCRCAVTVVP